MRKTQHQFGHLGNKNKGVLFDVKELRLNNREKNNNIMSYNDFKSCIWSAVPVGCCAPAFDKDVFKLQCKIK